MPPLSSTVLIHVYQLQSKNCFMQLKITYSKWKLSYIIIMTCLPIHYIENVDCTCTINLWSTLIKVRKYFHVLFFVFCTLQVWRNTAICCTVLFCVPCKAAFVQSHKHPPSHTHKGTLLYMYIHWSAGYVCSLFFCVPHKADIFCSLYPTFDRIKPSIVQNCFCVPYKVSFVKSHTHTHTLYV